MDSDCNDSPNMLLSASRDKTLIIWNLTRDDQAYGYPKRSLKGHSHIVSDCVRFESLFFERDWGGYIWLTAVAAGHLL